MKNQIRWYGDYAGIVVTRKDGEVFEVLVDTIDLGRLDEMPNAWCVYYDSSNHTWYATGGNTYGNMHRWIMQPSKNMVVDHINHDGLDNRRSNLRILTPAQNRQNRKTYERDNSMRNISHDRKSDKWRVQIGKNHKVICIGVYDTLSEAKIQARIARERYHPFANEELHA